MERKHTIINIGRQFGSGGKEVAEKIGSILGIEVYDNELISKAAEESGFSKELLERSDEKRSVFSLFSFFGTDRFGSTQNYVGGNELFKIQSEVIRGIADKGPAIFVLFFMPFYVYFYRKNKCCFYFGFCGKIR